MGGSGCSAFECFRYSTPRMLFGSLSRRYSPCCPYRRPGPLPAAGKVWPFLNRSEESFCILPAPHIRCPQFSGNPSRSLHCRCETDGVHDSQAVQKETAPMANNSALPVNSRQAAQPEDRTGARILKPSLRVCIWA